MAVYTEEVKLDASSFQSASKAAADSVTKLEHEMTVLQKTLGAAQDRMTKASALGDISGFRKAKTDAANLTASLEPLKAKHAEATAQMQQFSGATSQASASSADLQAELAEVTGGLSLVAEALAVAGGAIGAVVIAGAALAIEASEAKEKMTALFDSMAHGKDTGAEVYGMLSDLSDKFGVTRAQLAPFAQQFLLMGVTGKEALESLTTAAAGLDARVAGAGAAFTKLYGQVTAAAEGGQKLTIPFKKLDAQVRAMGLSTDDLASKMGMTTKQMEDGLKRGTLKAKDFQTALQAAAADKGAAGLARAGATLGAIWSKFQENVSDMFADLSDAIAPFLTEVKDLFSIFAQAQPSGQAMKAGIGGFFKEVFALATKLVPMVKHFLLDMVIYALKAYIALKPIAKWFQELLKNQTVMKILVGAFKVFGVVLLVVAGALAVVVGLVVACWAACTALILAVYAAIGAFMALTEGAGKALADWLKSAASSAQEFISGLVNGINSGVGAVVQAVKNLAGQAKDSFKKALGISSPSKVMMEFGGHVAGGAAEGISGGAPEVHAASKELAGAAAGGFANGGAASGGGRGGASSGVTLNVEKGAVTINGAGKSAEEITEAMLALVFERLALTQGLG